jgi:hypothetical protein
MQTQQSMSMLVCIFQASRNRRSDMAAMTGFDRSREQMQASGINALCGLP